MARSTQLVEIERSIYYMVSQAQRCSKPCAKTSVRKRANLRENFITILRLMLTTFQSYNTCGIFICNYCAPHRAHMLQTNCANTEPSITGMLCQMPVTHNDGSRSSPTEIPTTIITLQNKHTNDFNSFDLCQKRVYVKTTTIQPVTHRTCLHQARAINEMLQTLD